MVQNIDFILTVKSIYLYKDIKRINLCSKNRFEKSLCVFNFQEMSSSEEEE